MRTIYFCILFVFASLTAFPQEYNNNVEDIINDVDLESLIYYLRNISGEDAVWVNGDSAYIEHRVSNWGNDLAADYIAETFTGLGYSPIMDEYSSSGKNVLAVKEGTEYPDEYYMICAHYDAVDYYCADDNGSGTAAVLEAARIFSQLNFEYSVIFALWDEEEIGLIGANNYATAAASNGDVIHGVINMDMISWDGDGDMVTEIHSSYTANSNELSDYIEEINDVYDLQLTTSVQIPGTTASDHSRFWNNGYAAVLMIEEYYGGDFNPYYHTEEDRIAILNMPYFHEMAKLCIGTLASQCNPVTETAIDESMAFNQVQLYNYPNPFRGETTITYNLEKSDYTRVSVMNSLGLEVNLITEGFASKGTYKIAFDADNLSKGIYFLNIQTSAGNFTHKMLVQ